MRGVVYLVRIDMRALCERGSLPARRVTSWRPMTTRSTGCARGFRVGREGWYARGQAVTRLHRRSVIVTCRRVPYRAYR